MITRNSFKYGLACATIFMPACLWFDNDSKEIYSLNDAQALLDKADEKTLVIFDMDDTLIQPDEKMFHLVSKEITDFDQKDHNFIKELYKNFGQIAIEKNEPELLNKLRSAVFAQTNFKPVEPQTTQIIKDLQARGVKVIALTSSNTGTFYEISSMEKWREENMHEIGLDLSSSFDAQEMTFTSLDKQFGFYPVFHHGILCAAGNPKGKVLTEFLKKIDWGPSNIIFFDDGLDHCKSVKAEMNKLKIPVNCFWYKAACSKKIQLDHATVRTQLDYWLEHNRFLKEEKVVK